MVLSTRFYLVEYFFKGQTALSMEGSSLIERKINSQKHGIGVWHRTSLYKLQKCGLYRKYGDVGPQNLLTNIFYADILLNIEG